MSKTERDMCPACERMREVGHRVSASDLRSLRAMACARVHHGQPMPPLDAGEMWALCDELLQSRSGAVEVLG